MKSDFRTWSVSEIVTMATSGKLCPNPIGQRPPVSSGYSKSMGIVLSCLNGYGVGMITVRDIRNDPEMQTVYPGVDYLVIDGGHRVRALVEYYNGKFRIRGEFYRESEFFPSFEGIKIPVDIKICASPESIEIFRNVNETTSVNPIEMIMCDDQSEICKEVRSLTSYYKEYDNRPHLLFDTKYDNKQKHVAIHFNTAPNPRREWDKYVFVAIHKTIGKGNVDAGEKNTEELIRHEYDGRNRVSKAVLKNVERFLSDVISFQYQRRAGKLNGDIFSAFQLTWFAFYEKNQNFKITDMATFHNTFMSCYSKLTGTSDTSFNHKMIYIEHGKHTESVNIKEFFRKNMKNFSNGTYQRKCAELMLDLLAEDFNNIGVTWRDEKRSITAKEREERLALQGYRCAIDGLPLSLEDSVWGHDVAWSKGGKTSEGAVIRKSYNSDMGTMSIKQYKNANEIDLSEDELNLILNMRKKHA